MQRSLDTESVRLYLDDKETDLEFDQSIPNSPLAVVFVARNGKGNGLATIKKRLELINGV